MSGSTLFACDIGSAVTEPECCWLGEAADGQTVLEIGSQTGRSTIALASRARRVHAVDWHLGDPAAGLKDTVLDFFSNLDRYHVRDHVVAHVGEREAVLWVMARNVFDLAFIDGAHDEASVVADVHHAAHLVRTGGRIVLHDKHLPGVVAAVRGFVEQHPTWRCTEPVDSLAVLAESYD